MGPQRIFCGRFFQTTGENHHCLGNEYTLYTGPRGMSLDGVCGFAVFFFLSPLNCSWGPRPDYYVIEDPGAPRSELACGKLGFGLGTAQARP